MPSFRPPSRFTWLAAIGVARNWGERVVCEWQGRALDEHSFAGNLMEAAARADLENLGRLSVAFPDLVAALEGFRDGTLQSELAALLAEQQKEKQTP